MKIKASPIIGEGSGKLGSVVFSRNAAGPYVRVWVKPVNHRSTAQVNHRQAFSTGTALWSTLSDIQKTEWNNYAKDPVRFTPIYKMNTGGVNGLNAFVAHYVECSKGNTLKSQTTGITSTPVGLSLVANTVFQVGNLPPVLPVDGSIFGIPITTSVGVSYSSGIYTITLNIVPAGGSSAPLVVPPNSELADGHGNPITFAVYFSTTKKNQPNFSRKMVWKVMNTPKVKNDTANELQVTQIQITGIYSPSANFTFPPEGSTIDVTVAMITTKGQVRKLGQTTTTI